MEGVTKPAYCIPSMRAIRAIRDNGLRVASFFAGCGGSSLGYRMAGCNVIFANEIAEEARNSYCANAAKSTLVDGHDIREIDPCSLLSELKIGKGDLDILDGSPPCVSFSLAGKRHKAWGKVRSHAGVKQRQDDLFFEFIRIAEGLMPKVIVAENVYGLVVGRAKGYAIQILDAITNLGYKVGARVLDAAWLGVPQRRKRLFIIGVRNDIGCLPVYPKPLPYQFTVRDAIPWITGDKENPFPVEQEAWLKGALADAWDNIKAGEQSSRYFSQMRVLPEKPSPTVTALGGKIAAITHPYERRRFSISELKRICGFPDDFILTGEYDEQWARLGNCVPPPVTAAVGRTILQEVLRK